ncbi:MAG: rRNA pseudouridine synthase [Acidobacteria bacterium]|nr:rRNA pseudouridine synthase [Acidobacteriota bacterium]
MPSERLQKIIAARGIASRRSAEKLIASGAVSVNGQIVTELGTKADPERDHIRVRGKLLAAAEQHLLYLLMNKPRGYVTTVRDPEGRPTVMDLVHGIRGRVYPVGRLDYASEGLLLLTNDGELAHKLMKAASHVSKVYLVKVAGVPEPAGLEKIRRGLAIPAEARYPGPKAPDSANRRYGNDARNRSKGRRSRHSERIRTAPAGVRLVREAENPWYEITLTEGRNRQIRRMFEEIGHHVEKIRRVRYGPLSLDVPAGEFRRLTAAEIEKLKSAAGGRRAFQ